MNAGVKRVVYIAAKPGKTQHPVFVAKPNPTPCSAKPTGSAAAPSRPTMKKRSKSRRKNPPVGVKVSKVKKAKGILSGATAAEKKAFASGKAKANKKIAKAASKKRVKAAAKATATAITKRMNAQAAKVQKKVAAVEKKAKAAEKKAKAAEAKAKAVKAATPAPAAGTETPMAKKAKGKKAPKKAKKTGGKKRRTAKQIAATKKLIAGNKSRSKKGGKKAAKKATRKARKAPKARKAAAKPRKAPKARKLAGRRVKGRVYKAKVARRSPPRIDKKTGKPRKTRPLAGTWINTRTGARRKFTPIKGRRNPLFSAGNVALGATTVVLGRLIAEGVDRFLATRNSQGDPLVGTMATGAFSMQADWKRLLASGAPTGVLLVGGLVAAHYNHPSIAMATLGTGLGYFLKFAPQVAVKLLGYTPLKESSSVLVNRLLPEVASNYQPPPAGALDHGPHAGVGCGCSSCRNQMTEGSSGCACPKARPGQPQKVQPPQQRRIVPVPLPDSGSGNGQSRNPGVVPGFVPPVVNGGGDRPGFPGTNGGGSSGGSGRLPELVVPHVVRKIPPPAGKSRAFAPRLREDIDKLKVSRPGADILGVAPREIVK